ncbi:hypothetical protein BKA82DRAFT_1000727, partial [Pisolithus tinctorius]
TLPHPSYSTVTKLVDKDFLITHPSVIQLVPSTNRHSGGLYNNVPGKSVRAKRMATTF